MDNVSADFEHEIPNGSKLYFGKTARLKREIENYASEIFNKYDFQEILTPYFSYHQRLSVSPDKLLKISDPINKEVAIRGDSTIDVVRILRRRLKDESLKRLFYIQPIFRYPSEEVYQIGAELIGENNLAMCIKIVGEILAEFGLKPKLQLSNLQIVEAVCKELDLDIKNFEYGKIDKIFAQKCDWLDALASLSDIADLENVFDLVPQSIKKPLRDLGNLAEICTNFELCLSPLYYSKMRYYDKLFFRFFDDNEILCNGGDYEIDEQDSSGFALLTDSVIKKIVEK